MSEVHIRTMNPKTGLLPVGAALEELSWQQLDIVEIPEEEIADLV